VIAEAVDAAMTVGWALLVWVVLTAVAATAALYTLVVGVWVAGRLAWRMVRLARAHRTPPSDLPIPASIAARRRPQPSWAVPSDPEALNASPSPESETRNIA